MSLHILSLREFGSCLQSKAALVNFFFFFNFYSSSQNMDAATGTPVLIRSGTQAPHGGEPPPRNRGAAVACPPVKVGQGEQGEAGGCCREPGSHTCAPYFRSRAPHREATSVSALCSVQTRLRHRCVLQNRGGAGRLKMEQIRALSSLSAPRAGQASSKF